MAHNETGLDQSGAAAAEIKPCLIGSSNDDWVSYAYGEVFRPATFGFFAIGVLILMIVLIFRRKISLENRAIALGVTTLLLVGSGLMFHYLLNVPEFKAGSTHEHANLSVSIYNAPLDLRANRFQSSEGNVLSDYTHLHDGNGDVIHKHAEDVTWGYFFWTIGLPINQNCMVQPNGENLCDGEYGKWTALVNGEVVSDLRNTEINDLDRVLLNYGLEDIDELKVKASMVPDNACLYSGTCPERGEAPHEGCGG